MTSQPVAVIFGVSGQDGAYLAHLLLSKGYAVHGVSRDADASSFERLARMGIKDKVTLHSGDLSEFRSILSFLGKIQPTEIYNLAGQSSVALSFELPAETFESVAVATINILEYLRLVKSPIRYFQSVSSECFGNTDGPANELTPFRPRSPYAMAKAAAYWTCGIYREAYGVHVCSGILSNHESPLRPARFVTRKIVSTAVRIAGRREGAAECTGQCGCGARLGLGARICRGDVAFDAEGRTQRYRDRHRPDPDAAPVRGRGLFGTGLALDDHLDVNAVAAAAFRSGSHRTGCEQGRGRNWAWSAKSTLSGVTKGLAPGGLRVERANWDRQLGPLVP